MMDNLTNYHSHCNYCDGRADMESFVRFAISKKFTSYGFSSHAPLPFSTNWTMEWEYMPFYLAEFNRLKQKYASRIELYIGLEIDYLDEESNPSLTRFCELPLDYRIGSVHLLHDSSGNVVDVDTSPVTFAQMVHKHFEGDLDRVVKLYYERQFQMLEQGGFDIVGHADKIHRNASLYRPGLLEESWYDDLVRNFFTEIAHRNYQMEVNTKTYLETGTFFPNKRYLGYLHALNIPLQVNSDAHYPERINNGRIEALQALSDAGYCEVMEMHDARWQPQSIIHSLR